MIGYYKKHVFALADRLSRLSDNTSDLDLLIETQLYILKRIVITEKKKSWYKAQGAILRERLRRERLPKEQAALLKLRKEQTQKRLEDCRWLLWVWRCFGDAIAFTYLDKWAIKPFLYETRTPSAKQTAGHITDKEGLYHEFAVVLDAKKHGVPALLTDLTNTIRHGDVCLLGASDPYVVEVKSSSNTNQRVARQTASIAEIHSYLENDFAENVRGMPHCRRIELPMPEVNYIDLLNQTVAAAIKDGAAKCIPESGVHYLVMSTRFNPEFAAMFDGIQQPIICSLNDAKNDLAWGCYYPFTLSIKKPELLYAFLRGDICIYVVFDAVELAKNAQQKGLAMTFLDEGDWAYEFEELAEGISQPMRWRMSRHFAMRIAAEFLSWDWALDIERLNIQRCKEMVMAELAESKTIAEAAPQR